MWIHLVFTGKERLAALKTVSSLAALGVFATLGQGCLAIVGGDPVASTNPVIAAAKAGCKNYASTWTTAHADPGNVFRDFQVIVTSKAGDVFSGPAYWSPGQEWKIARLPKAANSAATTSSSWVIADNIVASGSALGGVVNDATVDGAGNIIFVGGSFTTGQANLDMITRISRDGGTTWATADDYTGADLGGTVAAGGAITSDSRGYLYATGVIGNWPNEYGVLRRSTDHGVTWSTTFHYQLAVNKLTYFQQVIELPSHELRMIASAADASDKYHGLIFKSTDAGASFTLITDYHPATSNATYFEWAVLNSMGDLLITAVQDTLTNPNSLWEVLRSTDGGLSFTVVDSFTLNPNGAAYSVYPVKPFVDKGGNIYVPGYADDAVPNDHGIVRRSTDDGLTWTTLLDYVDSSVGYGVFYGFGADNNQNLFASGLGASGVILRLDCKD